jgi:hypothetical protein
LNATVTRPQPLQGRPLGGALALLLGAVVVIAAVVKLAPTMSQPAVVARVTIINPTDYQMNVDVAGGRRDGWFDLATVGRGRTTTVEEVADVGRQWLFRFSYGGVAAGELAVSRSELMAGGWTITVPDEAMQRLRAAALSPSAL